MKNKKNEELQSRREFFKKAAKGALPIIGLMVLGTHVISACGDGDDDDDDGGSSSGCSACKGSCKITCGNGCRANAYYEPASCKGTCKGACLSGCKTSCMSSSTSR